jgi:sRNA-binding carbon storage regulator CsrA
MNSNILQDFRVMQLAVVGAHFIRYSRNTTNILLEGIDRINIGDNIEITEISLHRDSVLVSIAGVNSIMPLKNLSYDVVVEIIATLKAKALDIANRDVIVNGNGKVIE